MTGPDEYHERVANNAFTNTMVKACLEIAWKVLQILAGKTNPSTDRCWGGGWGLEQDDLAGARTMWRRRLFVPAHGCEARLVVEQFDGYRLLEDLFPWRR